MLSNDQICSDMMNAISSCTKACCALIILRNIKILIEVLSMPSNHRRLLQNCVLNCLKNRCIYMSDDLVKLSLEILDLGFDRSSIEDLFHNGTLLHDIACTLNRPGEGCVKDKWVSFLRKIVNRFPVDILSMQNIAGHTPYDRLLNNYSYCQDEKYIKKVVEIFKPR